MLKRAYIGLAICHNERKYLAMYCPKSDNPKQSYLTFQFIQQSFYR
jgi:hypothetical protein